MNFTVAKTFNKSLERLTSEEQTRAKAAVFDFQLNPANPGFSYEKLHRAKTPGFRSARISADLRLILHQDGEDVCACYIGHHDDAYRWAEAHRYEVHPVTGAMQMVEFVEVVREVVREREIAPPMFAKYDRDYILALGVPPTWLDAVMTVSSEDALLQVVGHLPEEAGERLLELADGRPVPRPEPIKSVTPYEHPDAKRRFKAIDSKDALREALEYPWEQWIVFLHPTQRKMVERAYKGPARVSGAAGTGKTVVALHRAAHLARKHPDRNVLLTTFSRTLAFRLAHQLDLLLSAESAVRQRICVDHLHKVARDIWSQRTGRKFQAVTPEILFQVLERATTAAGAKFPLTFVRSEWENVIVPASITTWEQYKNASRTNRGTPLGARQRQAAWNVFEAAQKMLEQRSLMTWEQLCSEAATVGSGHSPFQHVVADEFQDFGPADLKFLRALAPDGENNLFLCGDSGQRIYKGPSSWLSLGIDVRGRSASLTVNYRTTEQIRRFADRILLDFADASTGEQEDRKSVSLLSGPEPQVQACGTVAEEIASAAAFIRSLVGDGYRPSDIAIFAHGQNLLKERAKAATEAAAVPLRELSDETASAGEGVAIGTMHRAKGLEFKAVVIMGCDEKTVPLRSVLDRTPDEADREAFIEQERRLLYVACTRARERLLLTHTGPRSRFL